MTGPRPYLVLASADGRPVCLCPPGRDPGAPHGAGCPAGPPPAPAPARVRLTASQRADVEAARGLVYGTGELLDRHPHAYVAGLLEGAASNLLDLLDTLTDPEGGA